MAYLLAKLCAWVFMYLLDLNVYVLIIEAASRACARVFMHLLDLNICVLIIERRRRESSGRWTARD